MTKRILNHSFNFLLKAVFFTILTQLELIAQALPQSTISIEQQATTRVSLDLPIVIPDLPPLQLTLPESEEVRLLLRLRERKVYVYRGKALISRYPVAVGRAGWETPTGSFRVIQMLENPGWTNPFTGEVVSPGPQNPLGERWIAFWTNGEQYIGFHGTPDRESVGRAASHGCVRMFNEHIRDLYSLVAIGTSVTVEP
ncbi:L,D-transpeptidase [Leptolyngbya ohadii]|uniref:L,D-transpeptidase n=1 Tax=Leptolyngbya ohadii TaxID=1962290 RepID=UPI000B59E812|nr:L,D-transpeptidase [Leptolyngbya ohadii]